MALLTCLTLIPQAWAGSSFDVSEYRHRAATDRAAGITEGRKLLADGALDHDPHSKRLVLWYMGGAAIGAGDAGALDLTLEHLDRMTLDTGDRAAASYAGFLRGAHLIERGEVSDGLIAALEAANQITSLESEELRITAASELCRDFVNAGLPANAREHCRRHTRLVSHTGDIAALARAEYLEASALSNSGEAPDAVVLWRSARKHYLALGLDGLAARVAGSLATDLVALDQHDEALRMAEEALAAAQTTDSPTSLAIAHGVVAEALLGLDRLPDAEQHINQAIEAIDQSESRQITSWLLAVKVKILKAGGKNEKEIEEIEQHMDATAGVQNAELEAARGEVTSLELQYREREQDLRIRELETENRERELALEQAQMEAERKEVALRQERMITLLGGLLSLFLIVGLVIVVRLFRTQVRLTHALRAQTQVDALTGIANRRVLVDAGLELVTAPNAARHGHALLVIDVDHFKEVNDSYGHPFGDVVLIAIAKRLLTVAADDGLVARMGGEEFAVLCPDLGVHRAKQLATRLLHGIRSLALTEGDRPVSITISIGIAIFETSMGDFTGWYEAADKALYQAKAAGRNRVETSPAQ